MDFMVASDVDDPMWAILNQPAEENNSRRRLGKM